MRNSTPESPIAAAWLAAELDRVWLLAERALRVLQRSQLRPPPNHPMMAPIEALLATRRGSGPHDEVALLAAIEAATAQVQALRARSPFGTVIDKLGLRPLEVEALVVVMAPHLEPALADLFAIVRGPGPGKRGVDLDLVQTLFRLSRLGRVAILDVLDAERPLLRWRLVDVQGDSFEAFSSLAHRAMRPSFDLLSFVCERGELSPELAPVATLVRAEATLDDLHLDPKTRTQVDAMCARFADDGGAERPWLVLWGARGAGKRTLAERIAAHAGRSVLAVDPHAVDRAALGDLLARLQREALLRDAVLYVGPLPDALLEQGARAFLRGLRSFPGDIVLGIEATQAPRLRSEHPLWELEVPVPSQPVRAALWRAALPLERRGADLQLDAIARAFHLTPGEIHQAAREASAIAGVAGHAAVRAGVERRLRNDLGELARRIDPAGAWKDLVLPAEDMDRVQELISRKRNHELVYGAWGYGERIGYGKGLVALFSGPPGTGKTMLASLIAQALELELYQIDLSMVMSRWVGETEKQLARVFDLAERAHAVLLFDEADSLFAKRTDVSTANDRFGNLAVNYLLQRLEQYSGVAILTTNKEAALDEALQRRLSLHLRLAIPEPEERERLWQSFLPARAPIVSDIDLTALATEFELSGGYIKNAAVRAAFLAASADAAIDMEILRLASALELEDMGRVVCQGSAS